MTASVLQERASDTSVSATSISLAFTSAVTAASAIHVGGVFYGTSPTWSFSDGTNAYTTLDTPYTGTFAGGMGHAYAPNVAAGATTVTISWTQSNTHPGILIREIGGVSAAPLDGHNNNTVNASSSSISVNATNASQPALISAICATFWNQTLPSATTGTQGIQFWKINGSNNSGVDSSQRVTTAGAQTASFSYTAGDRASALIAIFDEAAASGTQSFSYTMSGGLAIAGSAPGARTAAPPLPAAGLVLGGTSLESRAATHVSSGGLLLSGTGLSSYAREWVPSSGLLFFGTAPYSTSSPGHLDAIMSGGMTLSGSSLESRTSIKSTSGGLILGGGANYSFFPPSPTLETGTRRTYNPLKHNK